MNKSEMLRRWTDQWAAYYFWRQWAEEGVRDDAVVRGMVRLTR